MTEPQRKAAGDPAKRNSLRKRWLVIGLVSIPIWLFLAGFYLVEKQLQANDRNAAGALGTILAIVGVPTAGASAIAVMVLLARETMILPKGPASGAGQGAPLTAGEISRIEAVAAALREENLCDHRTAAAYHARLGTPPGSGAGEPPFEAKYRAAQAKLQARMPEMERLRWEEANAAIRRLSLSAGESLTRDPAFDAAKLAARFPGFSGAFYDWVLANARRFIL